MLPTAILPLSWQKAASDLFEYNKIQYVLVVDYRSRFIEFAELPKAQSQDIIVGMKKMFARHGVPQCIVSDNNPQCSSAEFNKFCVQYGIEHITSSPQHPSGNGTAERAVRTLKSLFTSNADKYEALSQYL